MPPPLGVAGIVYRPIILKLPVEKQFPVVKKIFDFWFPIIWRFRESKAIQFLISRLSPVVMYYPHFGLCDKDMYYEWMLLDTHDAMTDTYKHRRSVGEMRRFLETLSSDVVVTPGGNGVEAFVGSLRAGPDSAAPQATFCRASTNVRHSRDPRRGRRRSAFGPRRNGGHAAAPRA